MPEKLERAKQDKEAGKSASTQAGEFVCEEMHHVREGKHGVKSPQQAIAIGLSKARRAGVKLPTPKRGTSLKTRAQASGQGFAHKWPASPAVVYAISAVGLRYVYNARPYAMASFLVLLTLYLGLPEFVL